MLTIRLPKKAEYALAMMVVIAQEGRELVLPVHKMRKMGLRRSYLISVAKNLSDAHLIIAKEGRGGGYRLARDPKHISVGDIIESITYPKEKKLANIPLLGQIREEIQVELVDIKISEFV